MEYREISKLVSAYIDALPKLADKGKQGCIRILILSARPLDGSRRKIESAKYSQEIGKGREVRRAFIADKGLQTG